ncbi:MAG: adenosylcobinamide-GDP ribazoletransferase [endosymbiont of Seepiophila jonesi]|uniref:Adenosylcobinamide-GDP ribazoletransferase n=1 Tax=endosymbiont of Lamellibrachia luymesi TaxID=2200907 RepID=A0A370DY21_9GAMM|nr:MAG: adenosylcobinamide-GDP ribazoletransferase [endosymbiont of Seepiophila jonesi]RDH91214.1 MAG: adenosylcobinamide-GDP ribazoletransferase [endosymbiont of Lamellibrachia luymesi]
MKPFFIALQFLTRLPSPNYSGLSEQEIGRSLLHYPLVGLVIGILLLITTWMTAGIDPMLSAALLLALWTLVTGVLHLDGLADSADAWIGGAGDRERTLSIMKDPYCGPAAVVTLVLVLLIKFAALAVIIQQSDWSYLLLIPALARAQLLLLFLTTPYVRKDGLGAALAEHQPEKASFVVYGLTALLILIGWGWDGITLLFIAIATLLLLQKMMLSRIDGTTGDTAGALVEICEAALLVAAAAIG